jgi:hypothetical protein
MESPILSLGGVHLSLPLLAGLLVVPMLSQIGENPGLFALLLEALESSFEAFVIVNDDFRHCD